MMRQNALLTKIICSVTAYAFMLAAMPRPVQAQGLAPLSFDSMYRLAQQGNVEALRASVYRGLNIDSLNKDGNTGLCVAAMRGDAYTYNAFRAAGANPHHPCVQNVSGYDDFVDSSRAVPVSATSRDAYSALGKEEYKVSSKLWWWLGGIALIGGGLALAFGHHGGGKGGDGGGSGEAYNSLGSFSATKSTVVQQTGGVATNSVNRSQTSKNTTNIAAVNLLSNVLSNTEYMDVILKAINGASYTNAENTVLQVGAGVIGIDATKSSSGVNSGYINVNSSNASVGMVASESSSVINQGRGIISGTSSNGIDLNFTGSSSTNSVIGMYADTASIIENQGDIKGAAVASLTVSESTPSQGALLSNWLTGDESTTNQSLSPAQGTLVGMEAMVLNVGTNLSSKTVKANNTGQISLSASGVDSSNPSVLVSLVGMGSYLDSGFINGSLNINRAENVTLVNNGVIDLKYSGVYTASDSTALKSGLGGIVGMRADANTQATNNGNVNIYLNDSGTTAGVNVAAGMQSIHGSNLSNNGTVYLSASGDNNRVNYGMLAVKGTGKLADSISSDQQVNNGGNINLEVSNSYGMASFNGGALKNAGTIRLGKQIEEGQTNAYKNNIAIYGYGSNFETNLQNTGTIDIYSYESMAMQNDYSGATKLENRGKINVYNSARDTHVFGGAYSELHNYGDITYSATPTGVVITAFATGTDVFKSYTPTSGIAVMNTKAQTLTDTSGGSSSGDGSATTSNTEQIFNNVGATIAIKEASGVTAMAVETDEGKAYNRGTINISTSENENSTGTIGMFLADNTDSNALLSNEGDIFTNSLGSVAMASNSTQNAAMINSSTARIKTDFQNSLGMASFGVSTMQNAGSIQINNRNSMAMYARGASTMQNLSGGVINVGSSTNPIYNGYGIYLDTTGGALATVPEITNRGEINVWTSLAGGGIYTLGDGTNIQNNSYINVYTSQAYGIYLNGAVNVVNSESGHLVVGQSSTPVRNSYAIYAAAGGSTTQDTLTIQNNGVIDFYNQSSEVGYAIYTELASTVTNNGQINLYNANSNGIFAKNSSVVNKSIMNITKNDSAAIIADGSTNVVNDTVGLITVGTSTLGTNKSYGISSTDTATGKITNNGIIQLYNNSDSYGIYAKGQASVENNNSIQSFNDNSSAIYTVGTNTVTNNKNISVLGSNVYAIRGFDSASTLSATNAKNANITVGSSLSINGYGIAGDKIDTVTNNGVITINGFDSYGIYANSGTLITNGEDKGQILMNGSGNTGIRSGDVTTVTNAGDIILMDTNSIGIDAGSGSALTNSGNILAAGASSKGIKSSGTITTITNSGTISMVGNGTGIEASSGSTLNNEASGTITMNGENSIAIDSNKVSNVNNSGSILLQKQNSKGIHALSNNNVNVTNSKDITLNNGLNAYGVWVESSAATVTNQKDATITIGSATSAATETNGYGVRVNSNNVNNYGTILLYTQGYGVHIDSAGTVTNGQAGTVGVQGLIQTKAAQSYAVDLDGGTLHNYGQILTEGNASRAVNLQSSSAVTNYLAGSILIKGTTSGTEKNYAIYSSGAATITNSGTIAAVEDTPAYTNGATLIYADQGSNITNNLYLTAGDNSVAIESGYSSTVTTTVNSRINVGNNSSAIITGSASTLVTAGEINVGNGSATKHVYAIDAGNGVKGLNNTAIISVGKNGTAIKAGSNSVSISSVGDSISVGNGTEDDFSYGIYVESGATTNVSNGANITVGDYGSGIYVQRAQSITNGGSISISRGSEDNFAYGIYAGSGTNSITNTAKITASSVYGHGLYVQGGAQTVTNNGNISIYGGSLNQFAYGIYVGNGASTTVSNSGEIKVNGDYGHGLYVQGAQTVTNNGNISIGNGAKDKFAYGIYVGNADTVTNTGNISIKNYGQGLFANAKTITNSGNISIDADGTAQQPSIGINVYVPTNKSSVTINNTGTITIHDTSGKSMAIYVSKDYTLDEKEKEDPSDPTEYIADAVKYNTDMNWSYVTVNCMLGGTCVMPDSDEEQASQVVGQPSYVYNNNALTAASPTSLFSFSPHAMMSAVKLVNTGSIVTPNQDVDFGDEDSNGTNVVGQGGSYTAQSFTGTVYAAPSIVQNGFDTTYVNEDTFIGADNGINVVSESYLFDAGKQTSSAGNTDVVMTMKPFSLTTGFNTQMSDYLQQNYDSGKGESVFNALKNAGNAAQYRHFVASEFGFDTVPNLAKQSFDAEKVVGREINDDLMAPTDENTRTAVHALAYAYDVDGKGETVGYDDKTAAVYGYYDEAKGADWRVGAGATVIHSDSDYDGGGSRYNNIFEVYMPVIFNSDHLQALIKPKAGLARGHYRRMGAQRAYKASTKDYFYGFDTEARQNYDFNVVEVEPNVGFNLTGLYMDDVKEKDGGMKIKSKNVISAQSSVGADVKKKFEIDTHQAVAAIVGGKYYHEFGQKYRAKATMADMNGYYDIISNRLKRNFGLLSAKAQYNYDQFSVSASVNAPVSQDENVYYLFNMGYQF